MHTCVTVELLCHQQSLVVARAYRLLDPLTGDVDESFDFWQQFLALFQLMKLSDDLLLRKPTGENVVYLNITTSLSLSL